MRHTPESKAAISRGNRGKVRTPEQRLKYRISQHRRFGTEPQLDKPARAALARWAYEVIRRDGGRCVQCGTPKTTRGSIQAHHLLSKSRHPNLALNVDNGITLCRACHEEHHALNPLF